MGKRKAESTETTTTKPSILSTSLLKAADKSENDLEAFLFGDASSIHEEKIHLKDNQLAAEEDLSLAQDDTVNSFELFYLILILSSFSRIKYPRP